MDELLKTVAVVTAYREFFGSIFKLGAVQKPGTWFEVRELKWQNRLNWKCFAHHWRMCLIWTSQFTKPIQVQMSLDQVLSTANNCEVHEEDRIYNCGIIDNCAKKYATKKFKTDKKDTQEKIHSGIEKKRKATKGQAPGSKKACVCGHVFTETKMIGRKRYSGYRAMLCSRNDPRRKTLKRKNTPSRLMLRDSKKRLSGSPKTTKRKQGKEMSACGEGNTTKQAQGSLKMKPSHRYIDFESPEFIEKLHGALSDINKKIAKQSLLWMVLKSSKC